MNTQKIDDRAITPQEVADIVLETVEETQTDLTNWLEKLHLVAMTTAQLCQALQGAEGVSFDGSQSREIVVNPLVDRCLERLQTPRAQFTLTYNEICYCMALHAPESIDADFSDAQIGTVQEALTDKKILKNSHTFTPKGERLRAMLDCFMGILDSGGALPESMTLELPATDIGLDGKTEE